MTEAKPRVLYLDFLRIVAVFCVMMMHVAAGQFRNVPIGSAAWQAMNVYDSICRFAVPLFVMISGVFFLDNNRPTSLKKLFTHNTLRLATAFLFWSVLYALVGIAKGRAFAWRTFAKTVLFGHYHQWFLFMLAGLYLIVPLLRRITADRRLTEYYLLLAGIVTLLLPAIGQINSTGTQLMNLGNKLMMQAVSGYGFYFVLGYYLHTYPPHRVWRALLYLLGVGAVAFTVIITYVMSARTGALFTRWFEYQLPNTAMAATAMFVAFRRILETRPPGPRLSQAIVRLSGLSFGMYLAHDLFNQLFVKIGLTTLCYPTVLSIPGNTLLVFLGSLIVSLLIRLVPGAQRYLL